MSQTIRVPDPVYDELTERSEQGDVSRGAIVREWMEKSDKYESEGAE